MNSEGNDDSPVVIRYYSVLTIRYLKKNPVQ